MTVDPDRALSSMDLRAGAGADRLDGWRNRALPARPAAPPVLSNGHAGNGFHVAGSSVEQTLAAIYAGVLGVEKVGFDESFFDLGGDSLSAMRAVSAINTALGMELVVAAMFDAPSVRGLSNQLSSHPEWAGKIAP